VFLGKVDSHLGSLSLLGGEKKPDRCVWGKVSIVGAVENVDNWVFPRLGHKLPVDKNVDNSTFPVDNPPELSTAIHRGTAPVDNSRLIHRLSTGYPQVIHRVIHRVK
jgi:hypothetical protein